jgi:hypothetical protein
MTRASIGSSRSLALVAAFSAAATAACSQPATMTGPDAAATDSADSSVSSDSVPMPDVETGTDSGSIADALPLDAATDTGPDADSGSTVDTPDAQDAQDAMGLDAVADAIIADTGATDGDSALVGCNSNLDCQRLWYCFFPVGVRGASGMGTCVPQTFACPATYIPVCGCNGMTYANACGAQAAGQSLRSTHACP